MSDKSGERSPDNLISRLEKIGMLRVVETPNGCRYRLSRSDFLADPAAFRSLARELGSRIPMPGTFVVRDLPGDRVLAYELAASTDGSVLVSGDYEGLVSLQGEPKTGEAVIVADTHFTANSMRAALLASDSHDLRITGIGLLVRAIDADLPVPVTALLDLSQHSLGEAPCAACRRERGD